MQADKMYERGYREAIRGLSYCNHFGNPGYRAGYTAGRNSDVAELNREFEAMRIATGPHLPLTLESYFDES